MTQTQQFRVRNRRTNPGLLRRLGAILYDGLVLCGILFAATLGILPFNGAKAITPDQWLFPVYLLLISFLFFGWFWTHGGQTLGMRTWKIRVISRSGRGISWSQALIRFSCAMFSWAAVGTGYWWMVFNKENNGWHDILSRSRIVWMDSSITRKSLFKISLKRASQR